MFHWDLPAELDWLDEDGWVGRCMGSGYGVNKIQPGAFLGGLGFGWRVDLSRS